GTRGRQDLRRWLRVLSFKKPERKTYVPSNQPKVRPVVGEKQCPNLPGARRNKNIVQETRQLRSPGPVPLPTSCHHRGRLQPGIPGGRDDASRAFHRPTDLPRQSGCSALL